MKNPKMFNLDHSIRLVCVTFVLETHCIILRIYIMHNIETNDIIFIHIYMFRVRATVTEPLTTNSYCCTM